MSAIDRKTFNEMLRKDKLTFDEMERPTPYDGIMCYIFKGECLKPGIQYALTHFKEIADLDYKCNFKSTMQRVTIANLKVAKSFIETYRAKPECQSTSTMIRLKGCDSIAKFVIKCHLLSLNDPAEFEIHIDAGRESIISLLFGKPTKTMKLSESLLADFYPIQFDNKSFCTQIIFESADLSSAMDTLIAESGHNKGSPWRIKVIFIQESLRDEVFRKINTNQADDDDRMTFEENPCDPIMGGRKFCSLKHDVHFVFDVPPKYYDYQLICINFFRTANEVVQLVKEIPCKLFSIWTEKIGLFYEMVSKLNGSIIWSNCVGLIDNNTAQTLFGCDDTQQSGESVINNEERYAVHRVNNNGSSKYLIIPFGVSFAN